MSNRYTQEINNNSTRFTQAPLADLEFSTMTANPSLLTTFNAGDIVPIYCQEILPHETLSVDLSFVIRQTTSLVPVMGAMNVDFYAFFVPNRIVNQSWKNVQGENSSGSWVPPDISLCPLVSVDENNPTGTTRVPVGSVADYYGFPTQAPIPNSLLAQCHDLKFRGYVEIYNQYFRDQNYQPPIPYSKLNVFNGFFFPKGTIIGYTGKGGESPVNPDGSQFVDTYIKNGADGSYPTGAVIKALAGDGGMLLGDVLLPGRLTSFSALDKPLKANKLHDYFTSVLPSPQKGPQVSLSIGDLAPIKAGAKMTDLGNGIKLGINTNTSGGAVNPGNLRVLNNGYVGSNPQGTDEIGAQTILATNLYSDLSEATSISINSIRESIALQQVYETLARGGSRYYEYINSFFGLDIDNPFDDIPTYLGHFRRDLDLYQTAQTSQSTQESPQGNLSAYGYTNNGGSMFTKTFLEHGYVHIFAVVRHRNLYSTYLSPDNFRRNMLDFYLPQLSNLGEQPTYTREINPFLSDIDGVFGYREAWAEYRFEPDRVSAGMRDLTGTDVADKSVSFWNYADTFDSGLQIADSDFLTSNSEEILNRSLAVNSSLAPQFKGQFVFKVTKELPMPTYSVPGLDIF